MKKINKLVKMICLIMTVTMLAGCGNDKEYGLSKNNPVVITIWHYYNGTQKNAFDKLVKEFNDTVGEEKGIIVEAHNYGDVSELEKSVLAAAKDEAGSDEMPNIFAAYADTAYIIARSSGLADLDNYLTKEEQEEYVDSFIEEGRIGENGELMIFPIAKSSEILILNKTAWDEFEAAAGVSLEQLKTVEGVAAVAKEYYEWTDSLTPEVANDGKAFYGRDAFANYMIVGSMQLGQEMFITDNGDTTINLDEEVMRKLWDNYYIPFVKGYFGAYGRFRSDDVKTGKLIACTGSTTSISYFPTEVTKEDEITEIEAYVMPNPVFEKGKNVQVQQGAGMVVAKSEETEEYASVVFLKWFTESERNLAFSYDSGYLPVKKENYSIGKLEEYLKNNHKYISELTKATLNVCYKEYGDSVLYTKKASAGGSEARTLLDSSMWNKAVEDRELFVEILNNGTPYEEAAAQFDTEENFQGWFRQFRESMGSIIN